jgi:hypothetical protein
MGMIGSFRRLPVDDLDRLYADPALLVPYLEDGSEGFGPFAELDVDKAWHGIHFLLTGSQWEGEPPLDFIVNGGKRIGDEDVGYGPARGFSPSEVKLVAAALSTIGPEQFAGRYNAEALARAKIYPEIWMRDGDEARDYLVTYFDELRDFVIGAAESGEALVVFIT